MTGTEDLSWLRHRTVPARAAATAGDDDLSWIRHRRLPATAAPATAPTAPATAASAPATAPAPPAAAAPPPPPRPPAARPASTSLDLDAPPPPAQPVSTSLDLGAPPPARPVSTSLDLSGPTPPPAHTGGVSLDLSGPTPPPPVPAAGTSLDLSGPTLPNTTGPVHQAAMPSAALPRTAPPAAAPAFTPPRTHDAAPTVLTPRQPSVVLTRLQSGIGALTFEAAWSPDEGFALGCAYQLDSGASSVLRPGETFGPLVMDRRAGHQRLRLDLLQGRHLRRLIIFGVPTADPGQYWAGTLLISTHGHARIEVPVQPPPPGPTVLLSLYNVDGEIVLRAEAQTVPGRTRDACLAFGYDRIAWRDADTAIPPVA